MPIIPAYYFMLLLISDPDWSREQLFDSALAVAVRLARNGGHRSEQSRVCMFDDSLNEYFADVEIRVSDFRQFRRLSTSLRMGQIRFEIRDADLPYDGGNFIGALGPEDPQEVPGKILGLFERYAAIYIRHDASLDRVVVEFC
jgi:hypothetical protein